MLKMSEMAGIKLLTYRMQLMAVVMNMFLVPILLALFLWRVIVKGVKGFFHVKRREERPAVLDDEKHGQHVFIRLKSGLRLHCVMKGPKDAPLMLLLHGFPFSWYAWRHQLKVFSHQYRVAALDLRGYGESDKPAGVENYCLLTVSQDIRDTITALGYERCILVGHDWGGTVAMVAASLYPHQIERLVILSAPHLAVLYERIRATWRQAFKAMYLYFLTLPWLPEVVIQSEDFRWLKTSLVGYFIGARRGTYRKDDLEAIKYYMGVKGTLTSALNHYRAAWQQRYVNKHSTSHIYVPTLMVWGTSDFIFGRELAYLTKEMFATNARIELVEGASHWIQEEFPSQVNSLIQDFLEDENSNLYMEDHFLLEQPNISLRKQSISARKRSISPRKRSVSLKTQSRVEDEESEEGDVLRRLGSEIKFRDPDKDVDSSLGIEGNGGRRRSRLWSIKSSHALLDLLGGSDSGEDDDEEEEEDLYNEDSDKEEDLSVRGAGGMFYMGSCDDLSSNGEIDEDEAQSDENNEVEEEDKIGLSDNMDRANVEGDIGADVANGDIKIVNGDSVSSEAAQLSRKNSRNMAMRTVFMDDMSDSDSKYSASSDKNEL